MSIEIKNLTYTYPNAREPALKNINLEIPQGQFVLLMGPSGCGKTTLINCMNGLIPHVIEEHMEGDVYINDKNTKEEKLHRLAQRIGTVFQNPDEQMFSLTVEEEIAFGPGNLALLREELVKRVDDALSEIGIENLRFRQIFNLSGGQKQRVAIAAILAMQPNILVFDEPTSDLDPVGTNEVLEVIKRLNERLDATIILIEHKVEEVAPFVDRVLVMDSGKLVLDESPKIVFSNLERLSEIGIRAPTVAEFAMKMKKYGYEFSKLPMSVEEAYLQLKNQIKYVREKNWFSEYEFHGDNIVEIEDLYYTYPTGVEALRGIDLKVKKGEFVALIGQNGAGKSTLASQIIGLILPEKGRVLVDGRDTRELSVPELAQLVGYLFQNPDYQLFTTSLEKEIAFGPRNIGIEKEEIERRVEEEIYVMELEKHRGKHPHALSRGQRQRLAVASVLAMHPKILIMDEPTTGQDYAHSRRFMNLSKELNEKEGMTVICITHDMTIVTEYCKRTILLSQGKVLADGSTRDIFSKPDLLKETFLEPTRITQLSQRLNGKIPRDVLSVDELVFLLGGD
ncbi:MAG: ABC transporter ATP-binding protein [Candidatus Methanofastidiosia archaeon]